MLIKSRCKSLQSHHGNECKKGFSHTKGLNGYEWETSVHYPRTVFPKQTLKPVIIPAAYSGGSVEIFLSSRFKEKDKENKRQSVLLPGQVRRYKP